MAQSPLNSRRRDEAAEFDLRERSVKARMISQENTRSRRFSSSNYITSFREEWSRSFRTNIIISSTASSPGYNLKEEINPSTYSFSSALRALQARSVNTWECLSPEGFALNSKWNAAEKYICNPLSGEVPLECLSAKTLTGSSFRNLTSRITMSAPLIYPSHSRAIQTKPCLNNALFSYHDDEEAHFYNIIKEQKAVKMLCRDVGFQSKLSGHTSSAATSTPGSTPQLGEISLKSNDAATAAGNPPNSSPQLKPEEEEKGEEMKETDGWKEENSERKEEEIMKTEAVEKEVHHQNTTWECRGNIGCLSLKSLWRTRNTDKQKSRNSVSKKKKRNIFPLPCYIPQQQ